VRITGGSLTIVSDGDITNNLLVVPVNPPSELATPVHQIHASVGRQQPSGQITYGVLPWGYHQATGEWHDLHRSWVRPLKPLTALSV